MSYDLNKIEAAVFRRIINHFKDNTEIQNIDQIDRGYESIDVRLNALGAKIRRVND